METSTKVATVVFLILCSSFVLYYNRTCLPGSLQEFLHYDFARHNPRSGPVVLEETTEGRRGGGEEQTCHSLEPRIPREHVRPVLRRSDHMCDQCPACRENVGPSCQCRSRPPAPRCCQPSDGRHHGASGCCCCCDRRGREVAVVPASKGSVAEASKGPPPPLQQQQQQQQPQPLPPSQEAPSPPLAEESWWSRGRHALWILWKVLPYLIILAIVGYMIFFSAAKADGPTLGERNVLPSEAAAKGPSPDDLHYPSGGPKSPQLGPPGEGATTPTTGLQRAPGTVLGRVPGAKSTAAPKREQARVKAVVIKAEVRPKSFPSGPAAASVGADLSPGRAGGGSASLPSAKNYCTVRAASPEEDTGGGGGTVRSDLRVNVVPSVSSGANFSVYSVRLDGRGQQRREAPSTLNDESGCKLRVRQRRRRRREEGNNFQLNKFRKYTDRQLCFSSWIWQPDPVFSNFWVSLDHLSSFFRSDPWRLGGVGWREGFSLARTTSAEISSISLGYTGFQRTRSP